MMMIFHGYTKSLKEKKKTYNRTMFTINRLAFDQEADEQEVDDVGRYVTQRDLILIRPRRKPLIQENRGREELLIRQLIGSLRSCVPVQRSMFSQTRIKHNEAEQDELDLRPTELCTCSAKQRGSSRTQVGKQTSLRSWKFKLYAEIPEAVGRPGFLSQLTNSYLTSLSCRSMSELLFPPNVVVGK